jgi:hypothetical protein
LFLENCKFAFREDSFLLINPELFIASAEKLTCSALRRIETNDLIPELAKAKDFIMEINTKTSRWIESTGFEKKEYIVGLAALALA